MELPTHRISQYNKLSSTLGAALPASLSRRDSNVNTRASNVPLQTETPLPRESSISTSVPPQASRSSNRKLSYASQQQTSLRPVLESVDHAVKNANLQNLQLPESMTTDDFTRAVAVATVSALRHQQQAHSHSPGRVRSAAEPEGTGAGGHGDGGHDAPSWSRTTSASVLLACTALYAVIAGMYFDRFGNTCSSLFLFFSSSSSTELLVDVVDVILKDSGIQEKFLGITLFALVPNTTEFMNAISFALNGNIALRYNRYTLVHWNICMLIFIIFSSMEIGSAYALQVCLLQIPAMVAFSAWYDPVNMGESAKTFRYVEINYYYYYYYLTSIFFFSTSLIFPRWDVIAIILSMFLMTYTYIEAKSNYHRGSILILRLVRSIFV
jgi:Ca2+:H+ antiporter